MAEKHLTLAQRRLAKILPSDLYTPGEPLNKKEQSAILEQIAKRDPERYPEIVKALDDLGIEVARLDGSSTFGISDMSTPARAKIRRRQLREQIKTLLDSTPDRVARASAIRKLLADNVQADRDEIYEDTKAENNPLGVQIDNAGRGDKSSLMAIRAGELAAKDSNSNIIPILVDRAWSQGLTPMQFQIMQEAARVGAVEAKLSVASSGYANKTMAHAVHRLVVSALDDASAEGRGLPVTTDDSDNDGALLGADYGEFKRNTTITPKVRKALARMGHDEILVRSPIASGARDGGVLARDMGERNYGRLPEIGEFANLSATNALGEKVTQATLSAKHRAMVQPEDLEEKDGFQLSGFELIDKVLNPSEERRGFAVHSQKDGNIGLIRNAPQGGQYVTIGQEQHYLPPGSKLRFKPGDRVEAGDQLTEGIPDHVAVTKYQGIGEGRRRVVEAFAQALKANGQKGNRRNIEVLARGLLDRVRVTDEYGDYLPDDVVPYHKLEAAWTPRENAQELKAEQAEGKFLEKPVLHYSIGTPIRPSVIARLKKHGVSSVIVNDDPPPFEPTVVRATDLLQTDPDWMTRQLGGHQQRSLTEAITRGRSSDTEGTSYIGARAELVPFNRGNVIKLDAPKPTDPVIS